MFCKNCGFQMNNGDRFCRNCGYDNEFNNYNNNNNVTDSEDRSNIGLNIVSVLWPFVGFILYLCYKDSSPKKAKGCGKCALISFFVSLILIIVIFALISIFIFKSNIINDFIDESYDNIIDDVYDFSSTYEFEDAVIYYVKLASSNFYKEKYIDNSIVDKCYNIDELEDSDNYDGSIEVKLVNNDIVITLWMTDTNYYVYGVDYDSFSISDIKEGNKINLTCSSMESNNSL